VRKSLATPKVLLEKEEMDSRDSRADDRKQTNKQTKTNSLAGKKGIEFSKNNF
jgi:hypothetical protein